MINAHRAARLNSIEDDLDDLLGWEPSVTEDPDVMDLLNAYEAELILRGHL